MTSHTTLRFVATVDLAVASTAVEGSMIGLARIAAGENKRASAPPTASSQDPKRYFFPCLFACAFAASPERILASRSWPLAVWA